MTQLPTMNKSSTTPYKNAVLDDRELQTALQNINPEFGDFVTRVAGEAWGLPLIDQKTKALIVIAVDVVNQNLLGLKYYVLPLFFQD